MAQSIPKALLRLVSEESGRQQISVLSRSHIFARPLPATLSSLPNDGIGACVRRKTWLEKGINNSWWEVTRVKLKNEGKSGKAWGRLWWNGKLVTDTSKLDEPIDGGTRHSWLPISSEETQTLRAAQKFGARTSFPVFHILSMNVDQQFDHAVSIVQGLPKAGPIQTDYEEKLSMYSLYKQATIGNVTGTRPGLWDMLNRAKWDAWATHKNMEQTEAKRQYVETLRKVLKKSPDKSVARDFVRQLEANAGMTTNAAEPSSALGSFIKAPSSGSSSSGSSEEEDAEAGNLDPRPPPPFQPSHIPYPAHLEPSMRRGVDEPVLTSEEGEPSDYGRADLPGFQARVAALDEPVMSAPGRPYSAQSSNQRYKTPSGVLSPPPISTLSTVPQIPITTSYRPGPLNVQPMPMYTSPSAFDGGRARAGTGHGSSQTPSGLHGSPYLQHTGSINQPLPHFGGPPIQSQRTGSSVARSQLSGHPVGLGPLPGRPEERSVSDTQATLWALMERVEMLENAAARAEQPTTSGGAGSRDIHSWDISSLGMWSHILQPLSKLVRRCHWCIDFLLSSAYAHGPAHPSDVFPSPILVIIRRLVLDTSFILFVYAVARMAWRRSGVRRREVNAALRVLWGAVLGRNSVQPLIHKAKVMVDKAI